MIVATATMLAITIAAAACGGLLGWFLRDELLRWWFGHSPAEWHAKTSGWRETLWSITAGVAAANLQIVWTSVKWRIRRLREQRQ